MFSFFAIKKLLTAYHIDKSSTGKIIEPNKRAQQLLSSFIYTYKNIAISYDHYPYQRFGVRIRKCLQSQGRVAKHQERQDR